VPALLDGVILAGGDLGHDDVSAVFYGDLFRPLGSRTSGVPDYDHTDVTHPVEQELLRLWWAATEPKTLTRARTPDWVQRAVYRVCAYTGIGERALVRDLKQVKAYFTDDNVRTAVRRRVEERIDPDTRILIGHSMGSIVAYEVLCSADNSPVTTFVTLGSPLGIPRVIFDRLSPPPRDGRGIWPTSLRRWTNIADQGDIVPLVKELAPLFGERVEDVPVHNGAKAHAINHYLTARETGLAIKMGLAV
jgi:hypothetical protein